MDLKTLRLWPFLVLVSLIGCGAAVPTLPVVTIAPAAVTLQAGGGSQQFTATVTNASNTGVVWKVDGHLNGDATHGTITQSGMYEAPAAVPSDPVTVEAISVSNANSFASAAITLTPAVSLTLTPATASASNNQTVQFSATVANATNTAVTWSVNGTAGGSAADGTISNAGLYTAPASFQGLSQVTIGVASVQDPAVHASATVTLTQTVAVTVSPATATVLLGATQNFAASVTGESNTAVIWSVNGVAGGNSTLGTIDSKGNFTAPAAVPSPAQETVTATSQADATKSGSAQVTIAAPITVAVAPVQVQLKPGATQQFTATVKNASNTAVTWSVNGTAGGNSANGTISTAGLYTAPATQPGTASVTVTATSVQDPTRAASAEVDFVQPILVNIDPTSATINLGTSQLFKATVTGTSNTAVAWTVNGVAGGNPTLGTINSSGLFSAPSTLPSPATETITATSAADANVSASAQITLQVPPADFTLSPASSTMSLGKAQSGQIAFQVSVTAGFTHSIAFSVTGQPINVTATVNPATVTASGPVNLTLATDSISLAASGVPITITATSTDDNGNPLVQTATVLLTITGWAGHVHTVAGGPGGVGFEDGTGTQVEAGPSSLTSDGSGTIYFSDKRGTALRSLGLANQTVTTLVGGPYTFGVGEGDGMAFDPTSQTVYIADGLRNRIDSFKLGSAGITLVAGSVTEGDADGVGAAASFAFPHGLVISPDRSTLYVADTNNEQIRKIDIATGTVTTIAGQHGVFRTTDGTGTAATFCQPTGLAIDPAGANLYVSDQCGYAIRQIALPSIAVTTVAGNGSIGLADGPAASATFNALSGLAMDPHAGANLLYIADTNEIRALRLGVNAAVFTLAGSAAAGQADGNAGQVTFFTPTGLTAIGDAAGANSTSLFVADSDNGLLRRLDISNPLTAASQADVVLASSTIAGQPSHRGNSDGVGTGPDFTGVSTAEFSQPEGIVTDGKIAFVADSLNGAIRKIDLSNSQVTTVAGPHQGFADGPASSAAFFQNAGLAWVPSQNVIYIADTGNGAIRKLDLSTQTVTTIAGANASGYVDGPLLTARFNHPFGVLASSDGTKLYVADTGNNAIRLVDLNLGTVSTIAGNGGLGNADGIGAAARFAEPNGLAFDPDEKNIFISDFENEAIRELNLATGQVTTLVGNQHQCGFTDGPATSASLCSPAFVATDGRSLFWGDSNTGLLRVLNLGTNQVETLAGSPGLMHMADGDLVEAPGELTGPVRYNGVFGIALAPDDSFILFTDKTANVIRIIN
ncbi:MAG TPA: hypothetical protein VN690_12575 [Terriglobales bacterium]|nr:hypothetical protein [Terriglobales bacterium]